ncbi:hypothetical protein TcasGA2_TC032381 [Tribolium castaneum]|uniref:Uncharacterized protein n=1 Tax=Tribolium castaneum TaxID=7070 RepID=A0A139WLD3_TRICA|nr:hypothetical protein TcasGA2_TC032381 [Tribolium castaneum]
MNSLRTQNGMALDCTSGLGFIQFLNWIVTQHYTMIDKFKASPKPSRTWDPNKDPILRYTWMRSTKKCYSQNEQNPTQNVITGDFDC